MVFRALLFVALAWALACCAPSPRDAEPTPRSGGWVELSVIDRAIPADVIEDEDGRPRPPPCRIELEVDGTPVLSRRLQPGGSRPPYSVEESFRFKLAPGRHTAALYYSGCSTHSDQLGSRETQMPIEVERGKVTRLHFNGIRFEAYPPLDPSEVVR